MIRQSVGSVSGVSRLGMSWPGWMGMDRDSSAIVSIMSQVITFITGDCTEVTFGG